eukprot:TRINITY_DN257_c0_g1_i1.p1 TRINITY_DN257_c0_g1~~TRINITY_DN257_c0_g1_i1.p1  ORF type:complete len:212 (-),score=30.36 TRINITY_DN257_c0_g1_i1:642-1277(-)
MPSALVLVAHGSEDIELACITDVLVRGGFKITLAACALETTVTLARGLTVVADKLVVDIPSSKDFDVIALPGGMPGATTFALHPKVAELLSEAREKASRVVVGLLCATPAKVLSAHPTLLRKARRVTSFPATHGALRDALGDNASVVNERVVVDDGLVTSQGPGTSLAFALALVAAVAGRGKAEEVAAGLLLPSSEAIVTDDATTTTGDAP